MLKPFHRPRLWWGLWLLAVMGVVVLSLVNLSGLPPVPEGGDKVEHFLAYALLSASAMQLFATRRGCVVVAALLIALGVGLEFAQGALTVAIFCQKRAESGLSITRCPKFSGCVEGTFFDCFRR